MNGFLSAHDLVEDPTLFYERLSIAIFAAIVIMMFFAGLRRRDLQMSAAGLSALAAATLGLLVAHFVSIAVGRPRPFVAHPHNVHLFASHATDAGFPSDHATAAFAIAASVLIYDRKLGSVTVALAAVMAIGRVAIGVHYPSDVLVGALLGCAAALIVSLQPVQGWIVAIAKMLQGLGGRRSAEDSYSNIA